MFVGNNRILDEIADPNKLVELCPRYKAHFDAMKEHQTALDEAATVTSHSLAVGMTKGGTMQLLVKGLPQSIWAQYEERDPGFFSNRDKVRHFLGQGSNSFYKGGRTIIR